MTVKKANGFAAPYRSATLQDVVDAQIRRNGLLSMDGVVTDDGINVTVPPFSFVQNGLLVNKDAETTVPFPTIEAPFFLTVTSPTPADTDNLSFQYAKSPDDVTDTEVIIAEYDGYNWRLRPFVSIDEIIKSIENNNVVFDKVGALGGLITSLLNPTTYQTTGGTLIDKQGRKVVMPLDVTFPVVDDDPDWPRVDRVVYRRAEDSPDRIGRRQFLVGNTYAPSGPTSLYDTQVLDATGNPTSRVKALIDSVNCLHILVAQGYGESFVLMYSKYSSDRQTQLVAPTPITTMKGADFDAAMDSNDDFHVVYTADTAKNIKWQKFNDTGGSLLGPLTIDAQANPCIKPQIVLDPFQTTCFIVYQVLAAPAQYHLYFASVNFSGLAITAPKVIVNGSGSYENPSIFTNEDSRIYLAYEETVTGQVFYEILDVIGDDLSDLPVSVSGNTDGGGYGTLVDQATKPKIGVTDNKTLFITFLQVHSGTKGLAVWTGGAATLSDLVGSPDDFVDYDVVFDSYMNELHIALVRATAVDHVKYDAGTVVITSSINLTGGAYCSVVKDQLGSGVVAYTSPLSVAYTNIGGVQIVTHIGPVNVVGGLSTLSLNADQLSFAFPMGYTPVIGDRMTVAGSLNGNNGAKLITNVELLDVNVIGDTYRVTVDTPFAAVESPAVGVNAQFAQPDGNEARFIKVATESTLARELRFEELDTDVLLARIYTPGPVILNYIPDGGAGFNSDVFGVYGSSVSIDWENTLAGNLTIIGGMKVIDLINNITYAPVDASIPMVEGDALFLVLNGNLTPTYLTCQIEFLPFGLPIQVLGFIKDGEFHPHLLTLGGVSQLDSGEKSYVGEDLPAAARSRLGILSETSYRPYGSINYISEVLDYAQAIGALDTQAKNEETLRLALNLRSNSDRGLKMVRGGIWSYVAPTLAWSLDAYIQVPGLTEARNRIPTGLVNLPVDGDCAYVSVNRTGATPATLAITVANISLVPTTDDIVIIARRTGTGVLVGSHSMYIQSPSSKELDAGLTVQNRLLFAASGIDETTDPADINWIATYGAAGRFFPTGLNLGLIDVVSKMDFNFDALHGQLRPTMTSASVVTIAGADKTITGDTTQLRGLILNGLKMEFAGATVNFSTGVVSTGLNFTPLVMPVNDQAYYGMTIIADALNPLNGAIACKVLVTVPTASDPTSPDFPALPTTGQSIGFVRVKNVAGTITVQDILEIAPGSGSGGGSGESVARSAADGFRLMRFDSFTLNPTDALSMVRSETTGSYSTVNQMYEMKCDKSRTITAVGVNFTISGAPVGFALAVGNIIWVNSANAFRRVATVLTTVTGTLDAAFVSDPAGAPGMIAQAVWTKDLVNVGDVTQKTRARDFFPSEDIPLMSLSYDDSLAVGDTVPDYVDTARVVASAANQGVQADVSWPTTNQFSAIFARTAAPAEIPNYTISPVVLSNQTLATYAVANADSSQDFTGTSNRSMAQSFVLAERMTAKELEIYLTKTGAPAGTLTLKLMSDSAGLPSGTTLATGNPITISTLGAGNITVVSIIPDTVLEAGTYWLVAETDSTYQAAYVNGVTEISLRWDASAATATGGAASYNGTVWAAVVATTDICYAIRGDIIRNERLFLVFFPNPNNASVTAQANIIEYEASFYGEDSLQNGGILNSAFCMTDSSGTPINCSNPTVVLTKTQVVLSFNFASAINAGMPDGDLDVYVEGLKIPRYYSGIVGAYWKEVAGSSTTVEFWTDLSTVSQSIHIVRRQGVVDASSQNLLRLANLAEAIVGTATQVSTGQATHSSLQAAHDAMGASGKIIMLLTTITENVTWTKSNLTLEGKGRGSMLTGTLAVSAAAVGNLFRALKVNGNVTFAVGADGNFFSDAWVGVGFALTDSGSGNQTGYIQET